METLIDGLLIVNGLVLIVSLALGRMSARAIRRVPRLPPDPDLASRRYLVTAIVPARNEEGDIENCIESLLAQERVDMEIIAIDDHSRDRTGEILDRIAARDARLRVIHDPELRDGWLGKQNAMRLGFEMARGQFVLFTDADILHAPRSVSTGLRAMERDGLDFLSCVPEVRCESIFENVILPVFLGGFLELSRSGLEDPESDDAVAAGAYMLSRPAVIRDSAGLAAVRSKALDDVELARHLKKRRYRQRFCLAPELATVRLFKGNRDAFWGITKNVLAVLRNHGWRAAVAPVIPLVLFWLPLFSIALAAARGHAALALLGAASYSVQYANLYSVRAVVTFRPLAVLLFPLCVLSIAACIWRALLYHWIHGAVRWRGRTIRTAEDSGEGTFPPG